MTVVDDDVRQVPLTLRHNFAPSVPLALDVEVNQDGYLYVIRQSTSNADGQLLFPSQYYNNGQPRVRRSDRFVLPSDCQDYFTDCGFELNPGAGQEILTLIFSRQPIRELPGSVRLDVPAPPITKKLLSTLQPASSKAELLRSRVLASLPPIRGMLRQDRKATAMVVRNTDTKDDEKIVEMLILNKNKPALPGATPDD